MRVLIADDDHVSRRLLGSLLVKWGYEVVTAKDGAEAWQALQNEDAPRLAILDWVMPGMDGLEVCRKARKRPGQPYAYLILLTARGQMGDVLEGLEAGADDYLTKPFDPQELKARLRVGKRILDLQEELISAREALRFEAAHDSLTGLWNRAAILDTLERELARADREEISVGLAMADLDHFKRVNDTYGHLVGDAVLREAARRMQALVRRYDAIGRYGGEEFLVIVPGCNIACAQSQAERLRTGIGQEPFEVPGGTLQLTLSVGVTASAPLGGADADSLIRAADAALYRAKTAGRNRVEVAAASEVVRDFLSG
jgi:diguanylate cyclase (GGDEF)-like protein